VTGGFGVVVRQVLVGTIGVGGEALNVGALCVMVILVTYGFQPVSFTPWDSKKAAMPPGWYRAMR
jgi:hypothetical protein